MSLSESIEMYLETILILQNKLEHVRSVDIANHTGFSKPTISEQMKRFREKGYIDIDNNGHISLTEQGLALASSTYERHKNLTRFLELLGVDDKTAEDDACRIEHYISETTFSKIKEFIDKHS